jgi:hypothetical protein
MTREVEHQINASNWRLAKRIISGSPDDLR